MVDQGSMTDNFIPTTTNLAMTAMTNERDANISVEATQAISCFHHNFSGKELITLLLYSLHNQVLGFSRHHSSRIKVTSKQQ